MLHVIILLLIAAAFVLIVVEDIVHINKAKTTLFFGALVWLLTFIFPEPGQDPAVIQAAINENLLEIATLWLFLMAAMTFVAYLNQKGLIESIIYRILPEQVSERKLMLMTALFCFFFSSIADNITATLISITLVLSLKMPLQKTLKFAVLVVFSVNSGGVALITGDVTTLMIFMADKVEISHLLILSIPSFIAVMILTFILSRGLSGEVMIQRKNHVIERLDYIIAGIFLSTIISTIFLNLFFSIPPVLTFLFGLSIMFLTAQLYHRNEEGSKIIEYMRTIEFDTLLFFLGVLLLVGMMKEIGVLDAIPAIYEYLPSVAANFIMGLLSAGVDNVPLTAALLKSGVEMSTAEWLTLTYAVGVGGSLLVIGSAAGIVAMSKVGGMTFGSYLRYSGYLLFAFAIGFSGSFAVGHLIHG
ncbi:sodium:proton antiporter NhaD [Balneatrix alpica]|uniref:Sodium:proton antiporter NhaD n=1 Tax=Balneatrix alpica TaxID=75684 RepID=A0ABV5ZCY6_9GAMM